MATRSGCQPGCGGSGGGAGSCDEIIQGCIADRLNAPLYYDPDTDSIGLCVSSNADSSVYVAEDGGRADLAGGVTPSPPRHTIADLPAFVFGAHTCGAATNPYGSPQGTEHAIASGIDWVDVWSLATSDGVGMWSPYASATLTVDVYTTLPGAVAPSQIPSSTAIGAFVDAGNPYNPVSQRGSAPASEEPTGRDQNWWGWLAGTWQWSATATMLEQVNSRAVVCLRTESADDVGAAIRAIGSARAMDWAMIAVFTTQISQIATITAAGLVGCVNVDADTATSPATVTASGATWVMIRYDQTDARITSFVNAGLNVMIITDSTQDQTRRAQALGARGMTAMDPVYARGALATTESLRYRTGSISWRDKGIRPGTLTNFTAGFNIVNGRGYTTNTVAGRVSETRYGWLNNRETPQAFVSTLLGELCPLPNASTYSISWTTLIRSPRPAGNFAKTGIFFGFAGDSHLAVSDSTLPVSGKNGYVAFLRPANGAIVIGKITNGVYTQLATTAGTAPAVNTLIPLSLVVTPTSITFRRGSQTVTANDADYRGVYCFEQKEESLPDATFQCATDTWVYNPG